MSQWNVGITLYEVAKVIATNAHEGQTRKYTDEPYIEHPLAVGRMVWGLLRASESEARKEAQYTTPVFSVDAVLAAAVMHDTVEDTSITIAQVERLLGPVVAGYVWYLTDPPVCVGNRATRKALSLERLSNAPPEVRLIKMCDIVHNRMSIAEHDPKFYKTFLRETNALLDAMGWPDAKA